MAKKNTGGPAFPVKEPSDRDDMGMTLRDYFAAKALQGVVTAFMDAKNFDTMKKRCELRGMTVGKFITGFAYEAADDMLLERDK